MSDADKQLIDALQAKNKELEDRIAQLEKQQGAPSQSSQPSKPAAKTPTRLKAGDATGHIGRLASDTVLVRLTDADGEGIEGQTVRFYVGGKEVGSDLTDANGEIRTNSGQHIGQPLNWVNALGNGYTAEFEGSKEYKPSHTQAGVGVGA
ncbi:hypothetical protein [Streptomyces lunalinharesii]|uniref:Uncharacterized protein n=1 Tax=Streptomyces lunalinharesii TaxID=333384 RepID=A0ABN3RJ21_9ACTN